MGQITHEDLNVKLSEEIKESARLSEINQGKIKEQEEKTASLPELQSDFTEHVAQIASTEKLGHIKVDGTTIKVDPITGTISSDTIATKEYIGDLNSLTENGYYNANNPLNAPITGSKWLISVIKSHDGNTVWQEARVNGTNNLRESFFRRVGIVSGDSVIWGTPQLSIPGYLGGWKYANLNLSDSLDNASTITAATANAVKQVNDKIDGVPVNLPISPPFGTTFAEWNPRMSSVGSMVGVDGSVKVIASLSSNEIVRLPSGYFPRTDFPVVLRKQRGSAYENIDGAVNSTGSVVITPGNLSKLAINDILFFNFTFLKK